VYENKAEECKINIMGLSVKKNGRVYELNGPDIMASNDLENSNRVGITTKKINYADNTFKYEFPPHSATVIELLIG
jgi:alpha-L-arabinofuranosidase